MGKINASDKIIFKNKKKRENMEGNKRYFYIKFHLKDCFGMEFTAF